MKFMIVLVLVLASGLAACGSAGSGGSTPRSSDPAKTATPAVAGTEAPKDYNTGKTPKPSGSPDDYMGY
jgi:hypothetical protein